MSAAQGTKSNGTGTNDAFVFKLDATGGALGYSTYLGGSQADLASAIAVDALGSAHATGSTELTFRSRTPFRRPGSG